MTEKTEINMKGLDLAGATSVGMRAGPLIFFGSQTPFDPETGRLVGDFHRDLPEAIRRQFTSGIITDDVRESRIISQAWRIMRNMQECLDQQGSSLDNIVHQRFFVKDARDIASLEKVILAFMPESRPSTVIVVATSPGTNPDLAVQGDFIAAAGPPAKRENITVAGLDGLTAPYPLATRAGQFVFFTPLAGVDPNTGKVVTRVSELGPEERQIAPPFFGSRQEAGTAQLLTVFRHLRAVLESKGASLDDSLVRLNFWCRVPMRDYTFVSRVRRALFTREESKPVSSGVTVTGLRNEDAVFECAATALLPAKKPGDYRREILKGANRFTSIYVPAIRTGPLVFTVGEVSVDTRIPAFISRFADLKDEGRFLPYGRVHSDKPVMAQAWHTFHKTKAYLESCGLSMCNVVRQTLFMTNLADYPAVERVATLLYGAKLPPTTVVPVLETSPYPECELEMEMEAVAD